MTFTTGDFQYMGDVLLKRCNGCGCLLPFTPEHYHRDASAPRGLHSRCKTCKNAARKPEYNHASWGWKQRHPERVKAYYRRYNAQRLRAKKRAAFAAKLKQG